MGLTEVADSEGDEVDISEDSEDESSDDEEPTSAKKK